MPYFELEEILTEIPEADLARITGDATGTTVNFERIEYARTNADVIILSYLAGRYALPYDEPIDPLLKKISMDMTICNLYEYVFTKTLLPNTILQRRETALNILKDIQSGRAALGTKYNNRQQPPPIISNKTYSNKIFNNEVLNEFI